MMSSVSIDWTFEQARQAEEEWIANGNLSVPASPFFQWAALHELEHLRAQYEQGEKFALMSAIRKCANHDLIMPRWVGAGYIAAFDIILNYRSKDWNEAFGLPIPKGAHLTASRKKRELEFAVFNEIVNIRRSDPDQAIDAVLFEGVGEKFNIGKTLAEEYYYAMIAKLGWNPK